jgi:hypothetical protein
LVQARPPATLAEAFDLGWALPTALPECLQKLVGHIRRNLVTNRSGAVRIGIQEPLDLGLRYTGRNKAIQHCPHIRTAMGGEDLLEATAVVTAATPPARRLLTETAAHLNHM